MEVVKEICFTDSFRDTPVIKRCNALEGSGVCGSAGYNILSTLRRAYPVLVESGGGVYVRSTKHGVRDHVLAGSITDSIYSDLCLEQ